jgi:hypothetical protein
VCVCVCVCFFLKVSDSYVCNSVKVLGDKARWKYSEVMTSPFLSHMSAKFLVFTPLPSWKNESQHLG